MKEIYFEPKDYISEEMKKILERGKVEKKVKNKKVKTQFEEEKEILPQKITKEVWKCVKNHKS